MTLYSVFLCLFCISLALSKVTILTDENFDEMVLSTISGKWFVKFYAPWCGHCKNLAPVWESLSDSLSGIISIAEVDCTIEEGLASRFNINGFPTLIFFHDGKYVEYEGERSKEDLELFAKEGFESKESKIVPRMPLLFLTMISKLMSQLTSYLYDHPMITCSVLVFVGFIIGLFVTVIYYEMKEETDEEDMMEEPKEKYE